MQYCHSKQLKYNVLFIDDVIRIFKLNQLLRHNLLKKIIDIPIVKLEIKSKNPNLLKILFEFYLEGHVFSSFKNMTTSHY